MKLALLSLLHLSYAFSFTLNPNTGKGFSSNNIDIIIANNDCTGAGIDVQKYQTMIENAVEDYWNKVPTSALELNVQGIDSTIDLTDDTHSSGLAKTPDNKILAGCNASVSNGFDDGSILGSAVMSCSGSTCKAILLLNSSSASNLNSMTDAEIEVVIAHEIGHAFGLGHSEYKFNLMYYSVGSKYQKWLGLDDIDGVSYLYPHEGTSDPLLGIPLLGNCGTLSLDNDNQDSTKLKSLFFGAFLFIFTAFAIRLSNWPALISFFTRKLRN